MSVNGSIAIVIRCCNEEQHIGRLLGGILEQTLKDRLEIILVDSGSNDATLTIAKQFPVKVVSLQPQEFSFGRSLNIGCQATECEYIVIVSAHVYPLYNDWLEHLLAPFSDPKVALAYGKQRGDSRTKYSEHRIFAKWFPDQSWPSQQHPFCNNANAAIRRSCWVQLPYDETLTGLEDLDWARRAMQLGFRVAYEADAEVIHVHNETLSHIYNRYRREAIALKNVFPHERFSLWDFVRLFTSNMFSDWYHAWRDGMLWANISDISSFRLMQFWGTRQGFAQRGPVTAQLRQRFYYPDSLASRVPFTPCAETKCPIDYAKLLTEVTIGKDH